MLRRVLGERQELPRPVGIRRDLRSREDIDRPLAETFFRVLYIRCLLRCGDQRSRARLTAGNDNRFNVVLLGSQLLRADAGGDRIKLPDVDARPRLKLLDLASDLRQHGLIARKQFRQSVPKETLHVQDHHSVRSRQERDQRQLERRPH